MRFEIEIENFDIEKTLTCGQTFRYERRDAGFMFFFGENACLFEQTSEGTYVTCDDPEAARSLVDSSDLSELEMIAKDSGVPLLERAVRENRGLRLLNQNPEETLFSFLISQNNNIPRIHGSIERLCSLLGEERTFLGEIFHAFPTTAALAAMDPSFYRSQGLGYRDEYIASTAKALTNKTVSELEALPTDELLERLQTFPGVGYKVASCVALFGFSRRDCFPVDTWMEKVYKEDFGGTLSDRKKISLWFRSQFGEYSGYVQQYLYMEKRSLYA